MTAEVFPYKIFPLEDELENEIRQSVAGRAPPNIVVGPRRYLLAASYRSQADSIYRLPLRPDDTFVVSFPRSGTTWTQDLVWLIKNNLDFETAKNKPLNDRYLYLEMSALMDDTTKRRLKEKMEKDNVDATTKQEVLMDSVDYAESRPSPRFIKTHIPLSLLPPELLDTTKVVYVARDPRDSLISFYHLMKNNEQWRFVGDFNAYFDLFLKGLTIFSPIMEHAKEAWNKRHHPNMCFIFYEDLCKDLVGTCKRVAEFFGQQYSQQQLDQLAQHLHFDSFSKNKAVDPEGYKNAGIMEKDVVFVRKGKAGGWREQLTPEQAARAAQWMEDALRDTDLRYPEV